MWIVDAWLWWDVQRKLRLDAAVLSGTGSKADATQEKAHMSTILAKLLDTTSGP